VRPDPAGPLIVDGQIVPGPYRSPLDIDPDTGDYPTALRGGVITAPAEIQAIRRCVEYGALPWWRRAITRTPHGWRPGALPRAIPLTPTSRPLELTMPKKTEPDVNVHHTKGCDLCGNPDQHTHTQADWRELIDGVGDRTNWWPL
jgi:hypothetical protein